jgi:RNA polymerase sigma-70 factor (sigma-E family)
MRDGADRDEEFTAFVAARSAPLVRFARALCGNHLLAEDLVQAALEKVYVRWNRIEHGDPYGYVRQAVLNQHLSRLRRRLWREQPVGGPSELDLSCSGYVEDLGPAVHRRAAIESALVVLTKRERSVVVLRYVEDLSEADTAVALGMAIGTVKSTCSRALSKLRRSPEFSDALVGG